MAPAAQGAGARHSCGLVRPGRYQAARLLQPNHYIIEMGPKKNPAHSDCKISHSCECESKRDETEVAPAGAVSWIAVVVGATPWRIVRRGADRHLPLGWPVFQFGAARCRCNRRSRWPCGAPRTV